MKTSALLLVLAALAAPIAPARAQDQAQAAHSGVAHPVDQAMTKEGQSSDLIMPHITDSHEIEYPCFTKPYICEWHLKQYAPVHIGGLTVDLSPTKHVVMLVIAATLCALLLIVAAALQQKRHREGRAPGGIAAGIEAMVLYLRKEVILDNVGAHGERYVPYLLSVFFFILFANLLGLIPFGSTATGNISVTAMLAIIAFFVIEIAGIRALGKGYIGTIIYWPHDMPLPGRFLMSLIMTPVEIIGKFTKPFALMIRLFANMTAGHVMVLALISMSLAFGVLIGLAPVIMAVGIMLLEIFVAFLQAYVFTLLVASFIGQIREAAH